MKLRCVLLLLPFLFLGCQSRDKNGSRTPTPVDSHVEKPTDEPALRFDAVVEAGAKPNAYSVHLLWEGPSPQEGWLLFRQRGNEEAKELALLNGEVRSFEDTAPAPGVDYSYSLCPAKAYHNRLTKKISVPRDFIVQGTRAYRPDDFLKVNRVYFAKGARLEGHGEPIHIEVEEIIAPEATLASLPENATAKIGENGRNVGSIRIFAKRGSGHLRVELRGETGGEGLPGEVGAPGKKGDPGKDAVLGILQETTGFEFHDEVEMKNRKAKENKPNDFVPKYFSYPSSGGRGGEGGKGERGKKGHDGGNTPYLDVNIIAVSDLEPLNVEPIFIPGRGGQGGKGGAGGKRGEGGEPGVYPAAKSLPPGKEKPYPPDKTAPGDKNTKKGPEAEKEGEMGERGEAGAPGKISPYCIKTGGTVQGECEGTNP